MNYNFKYTQPQQTDITTRESKLRITNDLGNELFIEKQPDGKLVISIRKPGHHVGVRLSPKEVQHLRALLA